MCSSSFLQELEDTISYSPLRGEPMELYLDQFGSLLSVPDSVGDVVVKLNPSKRASARSVSLIDLEEDEVVTVDPIEAMPRPEAEPAAAPEKEILESVHEEDDAPKVVALEPLGDVGDKNARASNVDGADGGELSALATRVPADFAVARIVVLVSKV